ncbi:MAG TPA: DNA repair exonuclease [Deinococcales bacterium]|nr:DNA repair exonuclease [Deinococcales bacterium]
MRFSFAHVADLHLDTPFSGVSLPPRLSEALRDASLNAWDAVVTACLDRRVDVVLIAGDSYDGPSAGLRAQVRFIAGLSRLSAAGIPAFLVFGNHDPAGGDWTLARNGWPPGVHAFGPDLERREVRRGGELLAVVHGISYPRREVGDNLAALFRRSPHPAFQIGLLHANLEGNAAHASYAPCSLADLNASGLDYWALGHVHTRQTPQEHPCVVHYPGNAQGRHVNEPGARGFSIVTVDGEPGSSACRIDFVPADAWRFTQLDVPADQPDVPALVDAVLQAARHAARGEDGRSLVVRARLHGRSALHRDLRAPGQAGQLLVTLRDATLGDESLHFEGLTVDTRPPVDLDRLAERDDFAGAVYRAGLDAQAAPDPWLAAPLADLNALGLKDLNLSGLQAEAGEIAREAAALALDAVLGGEA